MHKLNEVESQMFCVLMLHNNLQFKMVKSCPSVYVKIYGIFMLCNNSECIIGTAYCGHHCKGLYLRGIYGIHEP